MPSTFTQTNWSMTNTETPNIQDIFLLNGIPNVPQWRTPKSSLGVSGTPLIRGMETHSDQYGGRGRLTGKF
ncbi:hypothetical protein J6590_093397 [Homalodisca vitripennis]|nr:hypothetical protein J6590_093397 [Homalodisca vitripennis]